MESLLRTMLIQANVIWQKGDFTMPLHIIHGDIITMPVDAVVNAANTALQRGGGVCGAIFAAAGADKLQAECDRIGAASVRRLSPEAMTFRPGTSFTPPALSGEAEILMRPVCCIIAIPTLCGWPCKMTADPSPFL
jgi:hypothetical protein